MYNYYKGNSGTRRRVVEPGESISRNAAENIPEKQLPQNRTRSMRYPEYPERRSGGLLEQLGGFIPGKLGKLETEDMILLLILYLMYRDSGDTELLIIMGAMLLL